jgi:hypothetical protein
LEEIPEEESKEDDQSEIDDACQCDGSLSQVEDRDVPDEAAGVTVAGDMMDKGN